MATIIKQVPPPHDCYYELDTSLGTRYEAGTVAECSCGNQFVFFRKRKKLAWLYDLLWTLFHFLIEEETFGWKERSHDDIETDRFEREKRRS